MPLGGSDGPKHPNTSNATHRTGRISPDLSTGNHCPTQAESSRNEAASPGSTGRRQDALAMFDLYGVSRPEGWLSKGGFRPGSRTKKLQICHSCGDSLQPGAQCSRCGHDFCSKCAAEVPETGTSSMRPACERGQPTHSSHHPSCFSLDGSQRTADGNSSDWNKNRQRRSSNSTGSDVTSQCRMATSPVGAGNNAPEQPGPSIQAADVGDTTSAGRSGGGEPSGALRSSLFTKGSTIGKGKAIPPQAAPCNARASKPRRLSDCVPRRLMDRSSTDSEDYEFLALDSRREEAGAFDQHHPICCTARRGLNKLPTNDCCSEDEDGSLQNILHRKIDQLYQHAEELQSSRNAIKHLASALESLDRDSGAAQEFTSISMASSPSRGTMAAGRFRAHALGEDPKTPVASSVSCHDLDADSKATESSPLRLHRPEMDDVFASPSSPQPSQDAYGFDTRHHDSSQERGNLVLSHGPITSSCSSGPKQGQCFRHSAEKRSSTDKRMPANLPLLGECVKPEEGFTRQTERDSDRDRNERASSDSGATATPDLRSPPGGSAGQEIPSLMGGLRHRRGTTLCQPSQAKDPEPEPWPLLRRVELSETDSRPRTPDPVPWSRTTLRKVASPRENPRKTGLAPSPANWRQSLRRPESRNEAIEAVAATPATPASEWRRNLAPSQKTPFTPRGRANVCSFCDPSTASSPPGFGRLTTTCSHVNTLQTHEQVRDELPNEPVTPTRVRVRQVEQDLAMKRAEELEDEAREGEGAFGDPEAPDMAKNDSHNCAWRDRYMDLNTELEKWKNEVISYDLEQDQAEGGEFTARNKEDTADATEMRSADEVGIEGLTIVVHMRYRDDLVINTDLKDRETAAGRAGPKT